MCLQADYDAQGHTPITNASRYGRMDRLIPLVNQGYDVNQPSAHGRTPILWACRYGRVEAFEYLLAHGAILNYERARELAGETGFGAPILDFITWIEQIVSLQHKMGDGLQAGRLVLTPDEYNMVRNIRTKLNLEAQRGNDSFFCALIHQGVSLETMKYDSQYDALPRYILPSILMYASIGGCSEAVRLILGMIPNESYILEQEDERERTALMYACQALRCDIVRMLIEHGADLHKADGRGNRARDYVFASMQQHDSIDVDFLNYLDEKTEEQRKRRGY